MITERWIFAEEHHAFRQSLRGWLQAKVVPRYPEFEVDGHIAKDVWLAAGTQGFLGLDVAEEYGGGGVADVIIVVCRTGRSRTRADKGSFFRSASKSWSSSLRTPMPAG